MKKQWQRAVEGALLWLAFSQPSISQAAENQGNALAQQEAQRQTELQRRQAQEREVEVQAPSIHTTTPRALVRQAPLADETPCFHITTLMLEGPDAYRFNWLDSEFTPFANRCLGAGSLDALLHNINLALNERGFVTSRASIGPQSMAESVLRVHLHVGRIGQIRMAIQESQAPVAQATLPLAIRTALPTSPGRPLNVRDLDHGAENLQRLPGYQLAQFIVPQSTDNDESQDPVHDLVLQWVPGRSWQANMGLDNSSSQAMGRTRMSAQLALNNLAGLADQLQLGIGSNAEAPSPEKRSLNGNFRYSLPLGYHRFSLSRWVNRSGQGVQGTTINFISRHYDNESQLQWQWLLYRDGHFKVTTEIGLGKREGSHHIDDSELLSYRRNARTRSNSITVAWAGANTTTQTTLAQTDIHRLYRGNDSDYLNFESPGTRTLSLSSYLSTSLQWGQPALGYSLQWQAQHTTNPTLLSDKISLGGRYSIRGFTGDQTLSANDGMLLRQELQWPTQDGPCAGCMLSPYAGLDIGKVWGTIAPTGRRGWMAGAAIGIRARHGSWNLDVSLAVPLHSPPQLREHSIVPYLSINYTL